MRFAHFRYIGCHPCSQFWLIFNFGLWYDDDGCYNNNSTMQHILDMHINVNFMLWLHICTAKPSHRIHRNDLRETHTHTPTQNTNEEWENERPKKKEGVAAPCVCFVETDTNKLFSEHLLLETVQCKQKKWFK